MKPERNYPTIDKGILGVAGEMAAAAELCRRNIYAQLTFGNQKKADILALAENGRLARIEVKSKQGASWPNCKGIHDRDTFIIFVDFCERRPDERPDFYVLAERDWSKFVHRCKNQYLKTHPDGHALVENGTLVLLDEVNRQGQPYRGCGVKPRDITEFKEAWHPSLTDARDTDPNSIDRSTHCAAMPKDACA